MNHGHVGSSKFVAVLGTIVELARDEFCMGSGGSIESAPLPSRDGSRLARISVTVLTVVVISSISVGVVLGSWAHGEKLDGPFSMKWIFVCLLRLTRSYGMQCHRKEELLHYA